MKKHKRKKHKKKNKVKQINKEVCRFLKAFAHFVFVVAILLISLTGFVGVCQGNNVASNIKTPTVELYTNVEQLPKNEKNNDMRSLFLDKK